MHSRLDRSRGRRYDRIPSSFPLLHLTVVGSSATLLSPFTSTEEKLVPHVKRYTGQKCYLATPIPEDAEKWHLWDNDLEVVLPASTSGYRTPATPLYTEGNIPKDVPNHFFTIVDLESDEAIGWCKLDHVHPINRRGDISILIGDPRYRGRGYGQEAVRLLLDVAFNLMNHHRRKRDSH